MSARQQLFRAIPIADAVDELIEPNGLDLHGIEQASPVRVSPGERRAMSAAVSAISIAGGSLNPQALLTPGIIAAQRSVVGAILSNNELFELTSGVLEVKDFDDEVSGIVYAAISEILEGNVHGMASADPVTISVQPGIAKKISLDQLLSLAEAAETNLEILASHVTVVQNHGAERNLDAAMLRARGVMCEEMDVGAKKDDIIEIFTGSVENRVVQSVNIGKAAILALSRLAEAAKSGKPLMGVPSGYAELDAMTAGFHPGQLIIIAARPGMGKTALALCIGLYAAAAGYPGAMVSMEMVAEELAKRAVSIVSGIDGQALRIAALTETQWVHSVEAGEYLLTIPFEIIDTPGIKLAAVAKHCRQLVRLKKLKLLIIDYLQIMTPSNSSVIREQQIAILSRGFKLLARELGIPIILLSQLNRGVDARVDKRPVLSDLRESGSLEQDADTVIFVDREEDKADVIVAKQRSGPVGDACLNYAAATTAFLNPKQISFLQPTNRMPLAA